jgi:hypothetical protein
MIIQGANSGIEESSENNQAILDALGGSNPATNITGDVVAGNTILGNINTSVGQVYTAVGDVATRIDSVKTATQTNGTKLDTINTNLGALNAGGYTTIQKISITRPNNTTPYTANDVFNNSNNAAFEIAPFKGVGKTGCVLNVILSVGANQTTKPDVSVLLFSSTLQTSGANLTDNVTMALNFADVQNIVSVIDFAQANFKVTNGGSGSAGNLVCKCTVTLPDALKNNDNVVVNKIYGIVVVNNAYTPVAQEVWALSFGIAQDA